MNYHTPVFTTERLDSRPTSETLLRILEDVLVAPSENMLDVMVHAVDAEHGSHDQLQEFRDQLEAWKDRVATPLNEFKREQAEKGEKMAYDRYTVYKVGYLAALLAVEHMVIIDFGFQEINKAHQGLVDYVIDQLPEIPDEVQDILLVRDRAMELQPTGDQVINFADDLEAYAHKIAGDTEVAGNEVCPHLKQGLLVEPEGLRGLMDMIEALNIDISDINGDISTPEQYHA